MTLILALGAAVTPWLTWGSLALVVAAMVDGVTTGRW
jgi:hypothetical protein